MAVRQFTSKKTKLNLGIPTIERIEHFSIPEPNSGCWLWLGAQVPNGYGTLYYKNENGGKNIGAHRASWIAHNGVIPHGMYICHRCDNRMCVNPEHLFLGTSQDNNDDMVKKGRHRSGGVHGAKSPNSKLNDEKVREILDSQISVKLLSKKFDVCERVIFRIRAGKGWKHIQRKNST